MNRRTHIVRFVLAALLGIMLVPLAATETRAGEPVVNTGWEQKVLGPSGNIDSVYTTVRDRRGLHAFMSNGETVYYDQKRDGTLTSPRLILRSGPKGSSDQCGVHPAGPVVKVTNKYWYTFYHAERANPLQYGGKCYVSGKPRPEMRWTVRRMYTKNGGRTWVKDDQVLTQDKQFVSWDADITAWANAKRDDAGSPRLVVTGKWLYMFYRAVNEDTPDDQQLSVARAPVGKQGSAGSWRKYHHGTWNQPGLGGKQSRVHEALPSQARGITWNTYLGSYVTVAVTNRGGIALYKSAGRDLFSWEFYAQLSGPVTDEGTWGHACDPREGLPAAIGYGATIGWDGSSAETGRRFWVYYMRKPAGKCFSTRYLVRRQVALNTPLADYPRPKVWNGEPR